MDALKKVFGIDLRSLALLRVCLALLILLDLFLRSFDINTFYTDAGVWPRSSWLDATNKLHFSIHAASGDLLWQIILFVLAAVFALGFAGWLSQQANGIFVIPAVSVADQS